MTCSSFASALFGFVELARLLCAEWRRWGSGEQAVELESVQLVDGMLTLGGDGGYLACNGFTEPLRARLRDGGLLWVGGAAVIRDDRNRARGGGGGEARHGLASVLGGWGRVAAGRVLVGGDDVSQLPLSEVRRQVVVVSPRQPLLVSGTVRQNLDLLGKAQGDWEIWAALEQCLFADVVRSWPGRSSPCLLVLSWGLDAFAASLACLGPNHPCSSGPLCSPPCSASSSLFCRECLASSIERVPHPLSSPA
jgi:hypothetical protein